MKNLNIPILQSFIQFVFVFEYFTLFEYIRIVSVFTNSIRIRIRLKLQNEYYSVFVFVPKSLFVPTLVRSLYKSADMEEDLSITLEPMGGF